MNNRLMFYLLVTVLQFFSSNFVILAYGQSGCEQADWGPPLERDINVTRPFNPNHPSDPHYGVDYAANSGDNVLSVADGKILKKDYQYNDKTKKGWGEYVVIKHSDGSTTLYAHLVEGSTNYLYEEMPVRKGDTIGKADATGGVRGTTGNHLHLEYSPSGEPFDKAVKRDPNPCIVCSSQNPATITLSGPDAPTNGSQYTASGGVEPYTWTISKGSITQTGVVTVSGQCGAATVTVQDECGNQATKDVRMPNGVWVGTSEVLYYTYQCNNRCGWPYYYCNGFCSSTPCASIICDTPINAVKKLEHYGEAYCLNPANISSVQACLSNSGVPAWPSCAPPASGSCPGNLLGCGSGDTAFIGLTKRILTREWRCP